MATYRRRAAAVEAEEFDPERQPWPAGFQPWPNAAGVTPRDLSFGYVLTHQGRMHVWGGDWIVTAPDGRRWVVEGDVFADLYEPAEEAPRDDA